MKTLGVLLVALLLVLAACNKAAPQQPEAEVEPEVLVQGGQEAGSSSGELSTLSDALRFSGSVICDFSDSASNTKGTVYAKNGKMFSEYTFMGKKAYFIYDSVYTYIWGEYTAQAMKINVKEMEALAAKSPQSAQGPYTGEQWADQSSGARVDCTKASVADSKFVPPAGIQFTDLTAMLRQAMEASGSAGYNYG